MCFIDDYDWYAAVVEESTLTATAPVKCMECRCTIPVGGTVHHIHQQEYEKCFSCFGDTYDDCPCSAPKDEDGRCTDCKCDEPDLGQTYDYDCCDECHKFLEAVEAAEIAAGCARSESKPPLEGMMEIISESGADEARKYFKTARRMFPELVATGYLGQLWRRMFGRR